MLSAAVIIVQLLMVRDTIDSGSCWTTALWGVRAAWGPAISCVGSYGYVMRLRAHHCFAVRNPTTASSAPLVTSVGSCSCCRAGLARTGTGVTSASSACPAALAMCPGLSSATIVSQVRWCSEGGGKGLDQLHDTLRQRVDVGTGPNWNYFEGFCSHTEGGGDFRGTLISRGKFRVSN